MKTSDIPDNPILEYLAKHQGEWTSLWQGHFKESKPDIPDVFYAFPKGTHEKLILSKMRSLHKRKLVGGCPCGCRGDFEITDKGLEAIGQKRTKSYTGY